MSKAKESSSKHLRERIKASMEKAEEERRQELLKRRMELMKNGAAANARNQFSEAAQYYGAYIKIVEDWKGAAPGQLRPSHFDKNEESRELLLISGVYWDLAKIYDRSSRSKAEFKKYLNQFVLFSKGMPFEPVVAETLRGYLKNRAPRNKDEFKRAHKELGGKDCFVATELLDVTEATTRQKLRCFRDETLTKGLWGRILIRLYYRLGPYLARGIHYFPDSVRKRLGSALDRIAKKLNPN